jgi:vacuolar-type H+-ATPase subunit H
VDNKESYLAYLREQLDGWVAEVKELKDKAKAAGTDAAKKYPEQVQALEKNIEEGRKKIREFAEANEESWDSLKDGFDSAWKALAAGFKEAAAKFNWEKDK